MSTDFAFQTPDAQRRFAPPAGGGARSHRHEADVRIGLPERAFVSDTPEAVCIPLQAHDPLAGPATLRDQQACHPCADVFIPALHAIATHRAKHFDAQRATGLAPAPHARAGRRGARLWNPARPRRASTHFAELRGFRARIRQGPSRAQRSEHGWTCTTAPMRGAPPKETGELVEKSSFLAYGAAESDYRAERWEGFREDYRFTGKEEDVEVGLVYFGKRFLNPLLGRWVSADPLGVHEPGEADWNLYAYVLGQALRAIDPLGLQCADSNTGGCSSTGEGGSRGAGPVEPPSPEYRQGFEAGKHAAEVDEAAKEYKREAQFEPTRARTWEEWQRELKEKHEAIDRWAASQHKAVPEGYTEEALGYDEGYDAGKASYFRGKLLEAGAAAFPLPGPKGTKLKGGATPRPPRAVPKPGPAIRPKPPTRPTLPPRQIASKGEVEVVHNYRSGDHPTAHAHVEGGGRTTRIGPNGKPLKGYPELTPAQKAVVDENKSAIRRALNKIGRWLDWSG